MDSKSSALSTMLICQSWASSGGPERWGPGLSVPRWRFGGATVGVRAPGGQWHRAHLVSASHSPSGARLQAVVSNACLPPNCQQFPLGVLCALGCQHPWHDASLVPGGRGPHVPHMSPEWEVYAEQLNWPRSSSPQQITLPLFSLSFSKDLPPPTKEELKWNVLAFAGPPNFPKNVHMHWFQLNKCTYPEIK